MTLSITKTFEFSMGHALWNYSGKCHLLHGHNYKLEMSVARRSKKAGVFNVGADDDLDESGFVMDFGDLKAVVNGVIDTRFDHRTLLCARDERFPKRNTEHVQKIPGAVFVEYEPTAENILLDLVELIGEFLKRQEIVITHARLWETSTSFADWSP